MFDRLQNTLRENCPIRSFSDPYFPALGLNTERYHDVKRVRIRSYLVRIFPGFSRIRTEYGDILSVFSRSIRTLRIQSECGKIREKCRPE